jgi:hypothetical protein
MQGGSPAGEDRKGLFRASDGTFEESNSRPGLAGFFIEETKMSQTQTNGRVRRTLADQIDRLDGVIDALSEGLNQAVMMVVEQAVTVAVKEAVVEVLTNPELRARLNLVNAPPNPSASVPVAQIAPEQPKPSWSQRLGGMAKAGWQWVSGKATQAGSALIGMAQSSAQKASAGAGKLWLRVRLLTAAVRAVLNVASAVIGQMRKPLLVAVGVGVAVGLGSYLAGPLVAATISGLAGFAGSLIAGLVRAVWGELSFAPQQQPT